MSEESKEDDKKEEEIQNANNLLIDNEKVEASETDTDM